MEVTPKQSSLSDCWCKESHQDLTEAEAQAEPPVQPRLQQQCEAETRIHQPARHEWSQSAWNTSEPILSKLQKGVKAEYSRSTRWARASPLLDLAHPQGCNHRRQHSVTWGLLLVLSGEFLSATGNCSLCSPKKTYHTGMHKICARFG